MVLGGSLDIEAVLKVFVLLATALTIGLLGITLTKREKLISDSARLELERNSKVFWFALLMFFVPLILFTLAEVVEGISEARQIDVSSLAENLEFAVISLLNLGLLLSYFITIKMLRAKG